MTQSKYSFLMLFFILLGLAACDDEDTEQKIQVYADFAASKTTAEAGETIQFTDASLGNPESWEWTFQGGSPSSSTNQNPSVSFAEDGVYSVCLMVQRGEDKDKTTKSGFITIGDGVVTSVQLFANFSVNNGEIQEGNSAQFTDESIGVPTAWEWTFEGGTPSTSTDQNPNVSYDKAGIYSVCLIAKDGQNQDKTTKIAYIVVDYDLSAGLLAYYPFNGNANDESENSNDGVVSGATLTTDRLGNVNSAYSFDGVNDFIEVPHDNSLNINTNKFTLSSWVMVSDFNPSLCESNAIFYKSEGSQVGSFSLYYDDNLEGNGCRDFDVTRMRFKTGFVPTTGRVAIAGTTSISPNFWYYVSSTYDGSRLVIYVNGIEELSIVADKAVANNTASLFIGKHNFTSFTYHANAKIDEIRIYDRVLSVDEIKRVMNL